MSSYYPEPRMAEMIARNRRIDEAKKHDLALMNSYETIESCPCPYRRRQICGCKNSNKVVALGGSIIVREAMELCHCELSIQFGNSKCCHCVLSRYSGNGKCDNVHHLEALNGRAATFEAMGEFDLAKKQAEWILEMAPQLPDGYLRLGSIAQLQKNDDFAWEIYTTGIEAVKETTMDSSPKLQSLQYPLSVAFPRLEQLYIGPFVPFFDSEPVSIWRDKRNDIWPHLKVLIVEVENVGRPGPATAKMRSAIRNLTCINRGNSLRHIRLDFDNGWPDTDIFSGSDDLLPDFDIVQDSDFQNLQSFRSTSLSISPDGARNLLYKAIQTEQLTSFDIVFPRKTRYYERDQCISPISGYVEEWHADHLRGYDWTRGAPSIQSLGCYGLRIHPPTDFNQGHVVAEFLATFPNLRTLSMECRYRNAADFASFLIEIWRVTHLETMYLDGHYVSDKSCDQIRQAALDHGVELMTIPGTEFEGDEGFQLSRDWRFSLRE
ncbi:uncharacterized protein CPUR_05266 [Claviceps purpurea 20.1]|uniref:Uncharacterized protein n=1 Tax=Claviceps purpurea (strain 20.1) TaxID=1111077 RepID=M1WC28_CLAP2|nr:uncharacterized protein CPUR_05266 [Claviceps purpurea 20.1]